MDLLQNAITSIRLGVEDYQDDREGRMLSAVRNVHAGVLLLYKEALHRRSPEDSNEVLVKAQIKPEVDSEGALKFVGAGKKTVDIQQIRDRFSSLGIQTDWKLLDKITEARNDLEHYIPKHSQAALEGLITNAFTIVRDFLKRELKEDPLETLGESTWQAMLEVSTVYGEELRACEASRDSVDWRSKTLSEGLSLLSCSDCGSDLLHITELDGDFSLECSRCGATEDRNSYAPRAVKAALGDAVHVAISDGGDEPYIDCPECGEEAYVMSERRCANCESKAEHECERCGTDIPASEMLFSPMCGYCQYMYEKMLDE